MTRNEDGRSGRTRERTVVSFLREMEQACVRTPEVWDWGAVSVRDAVRCPLLHVVDVRVGVCVCQLESLGGGYFSVEGGTWGVV